VADHIGFELRCAERKFISLTCRVSSDSGAPAETAAVPRENDLLRWAGPFPRRGRRLAHIANRAPSGRPASHQSSNPLTQAGRIRTSMGREWIQRLHSVHRSTGTSSRNAAIAASLSDPLRLPSKRANAMPWRKRRLARSAWSPKGDCGKGQPELQAELRRGGGSGYMSDDSGEGNEPARGKTPTREEPGRVGERPDAGPGISASQTRPGE
jgi:hypothetical protein